MRWWDCMQSSSSQGHGESAAVLYITRLHVILWQHVGRPGIILVSTCTVSACSCQYLVCRDTSAKDTRTPHKRRQSCVVLMKWILSNQRRHLSFWNHWQL